MFVLVIKAVKISLVILLASVVYTVFEIWWSGVIDVYPLLVGIYAMTFASIAPYLTVNIIYSIRHRHDGRWIATLILSLGLLFSLTVAAAKYGRLRGYLTPLYIQQLKYDNTLALSLALLIISTVIYLGSIISDTKRFFFLIVSNLKNKNGEDDIEIV